MNRQFYKLAKVGFIILDLAMLNISFLVDRYFYRERIASAKQIDYVYLWMIFNLIWLGASWIYNIYSQSIISSFESFSRKTFRAYVLFLAAVMLYLFVFKQIYISRLFLVTIFLSIALVILVNRLVYLFLESYIRNRNYLTRKVIVVGYNDVSKKLVKQLEEDVINTKIIGYCENEQNVHELSNYPIIGGLNNIIEVSREYNANEIFSTIPPDGNDAMFRLIQEADRACIRFRLIPNFSFFTRIPMHIDYYGNLPVLSLRKEPLEDITNRVKKRVLDIIISSFVIIFVLSWMIPLIGLLIWLESRGSIFFIQTRTGKDNKPFQCIKFRSMKINKESNSQQASRNDPRITKVGKFLRRSSFDEFPQFLNVFLGQMSVVGPRPHMVKHTDEYSAVINKYMVRQFMKPGITGWAQVNGFRGETKTLWDMEKRVEYDLWYMENWSLWFDTRVIFLTIFKLLNGDIKGY